MSDLNATRELLEMALYDMMAPDNISHVTEAEAAYRLGHTSEMEGLFLVSYMLYSHPQKNGLTYFENYKKRIGHPLLDAIEKTRFGLYEVVSYPSGISLKDPIGKTDFSMIELQEFTPGTLLVGRLLLTKQGAFLDDDFVEYPAQYLESFKKSLLEKYNEFISEGHPMLIDEFLSNYPLVLMTYADLITEVEYDTFEEEDYVVYQSVFLAGDPGAVMAFIRADADFEVTLDESSYLVANLYMDPLDRDSDILAEIVIDGNRIEVDCTDEYRLEMSKGKLKQLLHDLIVHFKDEVLSIEDLME